MINTINRPMNVEIPRVAAAGDMKAMAEEQGGGAQADRVELSGYREPKVTGLEMLMLRKIKKHELFKPLFTFNQDKVLKTLGYAGLCDMMGICLTGGLGPVINNLGVAGALLAVPVAAIWCLGNAREGSMNARMAESQYLGYYMQNREADSIDFTMQRYPEIAFSCKKEV